MNIRKAVVGLTLIGTLVVGVGIAGAQSNGRGGLGRGGNGGLHGGGYGGDVIQVVLDETGLTLTEIHTQLHAGVSLADLITENGGDPAAVISEAVSAATERINTAVEDGRLTQERADALLADLEQTVTDAINGQGPMMMQMGGRGGRMQGGMKGGMFLRGTEPGMIQLAAEQTGLETSAIIEQMQAGASLGEILTANNVDIETFVDAAIENMQARMGTRMQNMRERLIEQLGGSTSSGDSE